MSAIALVILALMAVIGYAIGEMKGRPGQGAVLGCLLGPLGWLLVAVGKDYRQPAKTIVGPIKMRIAKDGADLGEMDLPSVKLHIKTGSLTATDFFYSPKDKDWFPLSSCAELQTCWTQQV